MWVHLCKRVEIAHVVVGTGSDALDIGPVVATEGIFRREDLVQRLSEPTVVELEKLGIVVVVRPTAT
jgi:hypothetical protein